MTPTTDPYVTATPLPWLHPDAPTAACAEVDPEVWFPDAGNHPVPRAICARCPLRLPCLTWAMENDPAGIWGGLGSFERRELRAGRRAA